MSELNEKIAAALAVLIGLRLSISKSTGNLRAFHFDTVPKVEDALENTYALHLSCPWRIEGEKMILVGSGDHYERAEATQTRNGRWAWCGARFNSK